MIRTLPLVAAVLLTTSGTGFAQEFDPLLGDQPSQLQQTGLTPPTVLSEGYSPGGEDILVTQLLGQGVFTSDADDAEQVGTITNLVVTSGQGVSAVVLSVGGFLGLGEKDVTVDFGQLEWTALENGSRRWVLATTAEALSAAPAFIWADSEETTGEPALTPEEEQEQMAEGDPNAAPVDPSLTTDQPVSAQAVPLDRSGFTEFDETGLSADELLGIAVYGINDELIGSIGDVLPSADGGFDALVVDVGGFLGIGAKPVAVAFENLTFSADTFGNRYLFLNTTREQLETQSPYDAQTYAAQRETQRMVITP